MNEKQIDREAYDMLLKECMADMLGLSDKERKSYILSKYNEGIITFKMSEELTRIYQERAMMVHG